MQPISSWSASSPNEVDSTSGAVAWECSRDLSNFVTGMLELTSSPLRSLLEAYPSEINVLELGCGQGAPLCSLITAMRVAGYTGKIRACFQDMDQKTIDEVTRPFVTGHLPANVIPEYIASDWDGFVPDNVFQIILSSECIYREDLFPSLTRCISTCLSDGLCLIAAKRYYFGCGGGTIAFSDYCLSEYPAWEIKLAKTFENGMSNTREILALKVVS